ncbi:hypothetical protein BD311DRAFT_747125 [Dichomitus squalens]|uniref:Uncharacterized protein n=1 Tax=Dichomitus squalens TaxID=114155 RepID=A0A4V2K1U3_9APHY|nr:hypothetical protein BD311DRAFT_747125 [Dichomitus squalens]
MSTRTPKKVDVHLPGPSPKDASAKKTASVKGKRGAHSRQSSVASLAREDTLVDSSPIKPKSQSMKPRSQIQRTDTQEDGDEESASGVFGTGRYTSRKGEAERRQFLEDDPNSGEVEPHRVYCKVCSQWVDLNPKLKYIMKLWVEHRRHCKSTSRSESPTKEKTTSTEPEVEVEEDEDESVAQEEPVHLGIKRVKKEQDRKAIIEADPLTGEVKPESAYCKGCQSWVKLSTQTTYSLHHWRTHANKCSGSIPSSRVATAQRKLNLVNDPQVKSCTSQSVECKSCNKTIELEGKAEYDLTKWEEHKLACNSGILNGAAARAGAKETLIPSSSRPPPSVADTEDTVVATDVASTPQKTRKRSREDDDVPERAVRPRDASYEPTQAENPGFLTWVSESIMGFFRGVREGFSG